MIEVSAPGKIHLIGEHSAVYGKPAILAAINLRFHAKISKSSKKEILNVIQYDNAILDFQKNLEKLISKQFNIKEIPNYKIEFDSELPLGSGLGSSAAFCAIFAAGLLKFLKVKFDLKTLNELAYEGEKFFNGNPSGGDNTTVVFGGLIWYRKETDNLKTFTPLPKSEIKNFILIDSGKPDEKTSDMVRHVTSLREGRSSTGGSSRRGNLILEKFLQHQEYLAKQMVDALKHNNELYFIKLLNNAGKNLETLGVVSESAKAIIKKIRNLKGGAKITGAGGIKNGSGMILAYHKNLKELIKFAKEEGLNYYSVEITTQGVTN